MNSYDLLVALKNNGFIKEEREELWWPSSGTFEVIVGTILTQQTKWERVEISLGELRKRNVLDLESLAKIDLNELALLIKSSGFYNAKAKNLKQICRNIVEEFGTFEEFKLSVDREWLLAQRGIGQESADSILCYGCHQEIMVVDSYTNRLLSKLGYEFESYSDLQSWLVAGVTENKSKIDSMYEKNSDLNVIYARFHGKIIEFCKENMRGKNVNIEDLDLVI